MVINCKDKKELKENINRLNKIGITTLIYREVDVLESLKVKYQIVV